jgi:hypothetical protein
MMRVELAFVLIASAALAEKAAPQLEPPKAGTCAYVQPGVKICSALPDGQGAFDVYTFMPAFLYVRTEDPIINVIPPDPHFFQAERKENTVVIIPTRDRVPDRTPAVITTKTLTITLNVRPGSRQKADTQVTVVDPLRDRHAAELAQATAKLEPQLAEKFQLAQLDELAREGVDLLRVRGKTIDRNSECIVIRAIRAARVGAHRYLFFSVENLSAEPFQVKAVRIFVGDHEERTPSRLAQTTIPTAKEVGGVIEIPSALRRGARLKLQVEELDARRTVELAKLEAP